MKILKDGTIKPCCDWVEDELYHLEVSNFKVFYTADSYKPDSGDYETDTEIPLNFCPNCGAKTEAEVNENDSEKRTS